MKPLVFRCDGNQATGLGHVVRSGDLAVALRHLAGITPLFVGDYDTSAQRALAERRLDYALLTEGAPLETLGPAPLGSAVLVDSYRVGDDTLETLRRQGHPVVVFDDFGQITASAAALVVNARVGAERRFSYQAKATALGPSYFAVPAAFEGVRDARRQLPRPGPIARVLVVIGGTDRFRAGRSLAGLAAEVFPEAEVLWVGGEPPTRRQAAIPNEAALGNQSASGRGGPSQSHRVASLPFQGNLAPLLHKADLLLTGGGRLKYEACFCLLPVGSLSQTEAQADDTRILEQEGLCLDLGSAEHLDPAHVVERLRALRGEQERGAMMGRQAQSFPSDGSARLARRVVAALGGFDVASRASPA